MKRWIPALLFSFVYLTAFGQKRLPVSLSIFDNQTSLSPTFFTAKFHPGFTLGTAHVYQTRAHHQWFQTLRLGYFYHQFSEHALQLYTETGYRYRWHHGISLSALLGAGYLHAFPDLQQFKWEAGSYVKKRNFGRPQLMATAALSLAYDLEQKCRCPIRIFVKYQFWLQMPFVNKYVPVLPNNAIHLGMVVQLPLNKHDA